MKNGFHPHGVVVPMVTPFTTSGDLDEPAVDRLVDFLLTGGVDGVFVLGTTGEGVSMPDRLRTRLVARTAARVQKRVSVYAGIGDANSHASEAANECLQAGADAIVAHPPISLPVTEVFSWFSSLLSQIKGPLILYNIPSTTNVSIPFDVVAQLIGHPRLAGIKDSENDSKRLTELVRRFGNKPDFSIFVGVGALMALGLNLGAVGIVPSVGNLIPEVCQRLCASVKCGDEAEAKRQAARMSAVSAIYQQDRTLGQSLAALKAAVHCRGLCTPAVLPPLRPLSDHELQTIRTKMSGLHLLN